MKNSPLIIYPGSGQSTMIWSHSAFLSMDMEEGFGQLKTVPS